MFGAKCDGVYVEVNSSKAEICAAPEIGATGEITCATGGATLRYTTDGSDPRYSASAKIGNSADVTEEGTVVRAYAYKDGAFPSEVTTETF